MLSSTIVLGSAHTFMTRIYIVSACLATLVVCGLFYLIGIFFGMAGGRTWSVGYYGEYNRVKRALMDLPGVVITGEWANEDTTLEEFGFDLSTPTTQGMSLNLQEADPARHLSGAPLKRALTDKLRAPRQPSKPNHSPQQTAG